MAKRRGNNEGTIYPHGPSGRWTGQVTVGRHPVSGKPIRRTVYGDTRQDVVRQLDEIRQNPTPATSSQKLSIALDFWLGAHKLRVDRVTFERYRYEIAPVLARIGCVPLGQVSALTITDLYRRMEEEGVSRDAQARAGRRLRQAFKAFVRLGMVAHNFAAMVPLPRAEKAEVHPLSREEALHLLEVARGDRLEALYRLALDSGARRGELFALHWGDLDLGARPEAYFSASLQNFSGTNKRKTTKTAKGRRRVPLTRATGEALLAHRGRSAATGPDDYVFTGRRGGPIQVKNWENREWQPLRRRAGLEGHRFHDLRHTCATLLLLANVHPKVVSERLGHAKIEITLNTYSHLIPAMQERAVEVLEEALGEAPIAVMVQ
jgi:integrase